MVDFFNPIIEALPYMVSGLWITVALVIGSMGLGLIVGVPFSALKVYGHPLIRKFIGLYVWFFRGVPVLVLFYLFYFGLLSWLAQISFLSFLPFNNAFFAAALVLGLTTGAYQTQIFKGAILALSPGQLKAARALGMSDFQAIKTIILPQALRFSLPAWSNEYSIILKDSALAYVIGVAELMSRTRSVAAITHKPLQLTLFAGLIFFVLTFIGVKGLKALEKKVKIKGYAQS
ncbi:amino acid ABC transporter permease [Desulfobacula sp.]|uniref:amino acid ABC transporter permease n=1 Tax=Desulfobacula sp. TaxID=2593537 RepID=UPI00262F3725|nr:amino acid ABC transporter permease [Desulfobacula sp.]